MGKQSQTYYKETTMGEIEADAILVLIPTQYGSLSVCSAVDLAAALVTAESDDDLSEIISNASIDQTLSIGWNALQAERLVVAVLRNNGGGDYWEED